MFNQDFYLAGEKSREKEEQDSKELLVVKIYSDTIGDLSRVPTKDFGIGKHFETNGFEYAIGTA